VRWPEGPYCPHCGNADQESIAKGNGKARRSVFKPVQEVHLSRDNRILALNIHVILRKTRSSGFRCDPASKTLARL
jgi:hypothetical protein